MNIKIKKLLALALAIAMLCVCFAACSSDKKSKTNTKPSNEETVKEDNKPAVKDKAGNNNTSPSNPPNVSVPKSAPDSAQDSSQAPSAPDNTKYGNVDVYEKDGTPHAKTDDGVEVEITRENFDALLKEYSAVQGSGSDREKELLNQIQLIMEAPRN